MIDVIARHVHKHADRRITAYYQPHADEYRVRIATRAGDTLSDVAVVSRFAAAMLAGKYAEALARGEDITLDK